MRAYPRGRGGTSEHSMTSSVPAGLSPRTRGNRRAARKSSGIRGPIPADAGEPPSSRQPARRSRAYPRGRGGTEAADFVAGDLQGLSPRTRGNRQTQAHKDSYFGPIPADAGEPTRPRVISIERRAYPRGRGGTPSNPQQHVDTPGLSPRTRGNQTSPVLHGLFVGPIPADAGEPFRRQRRLLVVRAYPRGRGGTGTKKKNESKCKGLSPRTRGNRNIPQYGDYTGGPIPADAGEPLCS